MPLVRIEALGPKTPQWRTAVFEEVHAALVEAFGIPEHDRFQRLVLHGPGNVATGDRPPESWTLVEITAFAGRSLEAKRKLYTALARRLSVRPGIPPASLMVVLHEEPRESWSVRGGTAACDAALGYKVEV
ncbi:MAG: tautomerase family protein [Myxococcales bacterium]|jgi:phenylpyruvate tautomerase PptA (4-oxalocrotonate tautomerase family)